MLSCHYIRGHSQTTISVVGGGGVHKMSTLLNQFGKFYQVKLSTRGGGGQKGQTSVNIVCERPPNSKTPRTIRRLS